MILRSKPRFLVGVTGFEPAASTSQTSRATNCATPRCIRLYQTYPKKSRGKTEKSVVGAVFYVLFYAFFLVFSSLPLFSSLFIRLFIRLFLSFYLFRLPNNYTKHTPKSQGGKMEKSVVGAVFYALFYAFFLGFSLLPLFSSLFICLFICPFLRFFLSSPLFSPSLRSPISSHLLTNRK